MRHKDDDRFTESPNWLEAEVEPLLGKNGRLLGGRYSLTKRIGAGGFAEVWLGNDIHGNIPKAIKIISRSIETDEAKAVLRAQEIITRLNHPYLVRTECFFVEQKRLIVVMELADGSLRDLLKKAQKESESGLPVEKLLEYMRHAAEALDYLHEEGVFHRDIKPETILLVGRFAKVAGLSLVLLAANRQSTKSNFAGTSAYSAPETWKGRVTAKSDQYSLAITYAEARLGRAVFKGSTIYEFMIEHLQSEPNLDPLPPEEQAVLLRALAKDPADRYASCSEFIKALELAGARPERATDALKTSSAAGEGRGVRSDSADRSAVSTRPPGPAWARVVVVAAMVAGVVAPVLVGLDWFTGWSVQTRLPGPPPERMGWGWVAGIAGASGLAVAAYAEWRLRRGTRSPAGEGPEGVAPDAEPILPHSRARTG
jgi:serine/threonine protein kinase